LLQLSYARLFAPIFWFVLFGPVGMALYYIVYTVHAFQRSTESIVSKSIIDYASIVLDVLNWVPLRLFTLTLALVQNFVSMFGVWCRHCLSSLQAQSSLIEVCVSADVKTEAEALGAINRALIVWLLVIALVTVVRLMTS